jgi:hypothetical protein
LPKLVKSPFDLVSTLHDRMTGRQALDALLAVYGDKGNGKSEACMYLAERLDMKLCKTYDKPPGTFFNIENVRSVDPEGTLKMFTAEQFKKKKHQVFVVDDASIAANARKFLTENNQRLNAIMTVARIYRHCVILNTVAPELIDTVLRSFANITCTVLGPDMNPKSSTYEVNRLKVYAMSRGGAPADKTKRMYNKYFQFKGKDGRMNRITIVRTRRPSPVLLGQYEALRKEKTDALIDHLFMVPENGNGQVIGKRERKWQAVMNKYYTRVIEMHKEPGMNVARIMHTTGLSRYQIEKMIDMGAYEP